MIITIDTETQGLNAQKFIMGCICFKNLKTECFSTAQSMRQRIHNLARKAEKAGEKLTVYAHNLQYDYISIGEWKNKSNHIYCTRPFIVDTLQWERTNQDGEPRVSIKWLDTMGLYAGPLSDIGETVGSPKTKTPEWLKQDDYEPSFAEIAEASQYCQQDTKVLMLFILKLREMLSKSKLNVRTMITGSQIAIQNLMKHLKERGEKDGEAYLINGRKFWRTNYSKEILEAYRGGRVEAFKTGIFKEVNEIDLNSLYPYAAMNIEYPKIESEKKIYAPLTFLSKEQVFKNIGVSYALVETPKKVGGIGRLPIRQKESENETTIYPVTTEEGRSLLLGTWTHIELTEAINNGYELHNVFWSITWEKAKENPLKEYMIEGYKRRLIAQNPFEKYFYKLMINGCIGKLAQRRPHIEVERINVEDGPEYKNNGWEIVDSWNTELIVERKIGINYKRFYAPIIAAQITAWSRCHLNRALAKIPNEGRVYCDTDSIVYDSLYSNVVDKESRIFKYGRDIGEWKRVATNKPANVYGKKAYSIGNEVTLNRVPRSQRNIEDFEKGVIEYYDIIGVKEAKRPEELGTKRKQCRLLEYEEATEYQRFFIDAQTEPTEKELQHCFSLLTTSPS